MNANREHMRSDHGDALENWERWPLALLFIANSINIFILYVPEREMPAIVAAFLPWLRVGCGVAAAASLEGTLIAVTMGRRLGRDSMWSWATMAAASLFTAAVAWYVHAEVGAVAAGLFMAQAVVLFIYSQHLAAPRKALQGGVEPQTTVAKRLESAIATKRAPEPASRLSLPVPDPKGFTCSVCGEVFETLPDVSRHARKEHLKAR